MSDAIVIETDDEWTVIELTEQGPAGPSGSSLPATTTTLGGVIVGGGLSVITNGNATTNGTLSTNATLIGLGSVDNTADLAKPLSNATTAALAGKANLTHNHAISDVTGLQTALDGKQPTGSYVLTNDSRLSDARTPTAHTHLYSDIINPPNLSVYQLQSTNTFANLSGAPNMSLYYFANNPTGFITSSALAPYLQSTTAASTYQTISGMSSYLLSAAATATYAPLASPSLTGTPTAPTAANGTATTQIATTAFVATALASYLTTSTASSTYATQASLSSYATLSTNTFTGQQNFNSNILDKPRLQAPRETYTSPAISSGTLTLDLSASVNFKVSLNAAITTLTISNVPASSMMAMFTLELTSDGTSRSIAWPTVTWLSGSAPSVPATNGAKTIIVAYTFDAGTTWTAGSNR